MAAITGSIYPQFDGRLTDANLQLADQQTITTSAGCTVGGSARVLDMGAAHYKADAVFDIGTVSGATGDFSYLLIQGSNSATFASGNVNLAARLYGDTASIGESADDAGNSRAIIPFENVKNGTTYRYLRAYVLAGGSTKSMVVNGGFVSQRL